MRLIDADRALEIVRDQRIAHPNAYHLTNYATLILQEAPTIVAPLVDRTALIWLINNAKAAYSSMNDAQANESEFIADFLLAYTNHQNKDAKWRIK